MKNINFSITFTVLFSAFLVFFLNLKLLSENDAETYKPLRYYMIKHQLKERGITDKKVLDAMQKIPRHKFVPPELQKSAYHDGPLPIGYGQTISQPYIVALMTELLKLNKNSRVLEVGTGSGYQAAVLAEIAKDVYTIEIVKELHENSNRILRTAEYRNIKTRNDDGYYGWKEYAPFDAIIVTCASEFVPPPLISQLKEGGIMCIPVGPPFKVQHLLLLKKIKSGEIITEVVTKVRFVPLVRKGE